MSVGTAIFLISLILIAVGTWLFLTRRPAAGTNPAPRDSYAPGPAAPRDYVAGPAVSRPSAPVYYDPAPRVIVERPVYVEPYSPTTDLANLIIAEEIIDEIHEERREERFEDMREDRYDEPRYQEPAPYEAPSAYEAPDNGGGWGNDNGGDFGSGDAGSF